MTTQIQHKFSYESALNDSLKVNWRVEDLIGGDKALDFTRPFLPDSLAGVRQIKALDASEQLALNHIRGYTYLHLFGFVEEFILPFVLDQARGKVHGESGKIRALLTFAEEEAKHIDLFRRFAEEFKKGFKTPIQVVGPAPEVASVVLGHSPLGVVLVILHLEWLTQRHYIESVKTDDSIDPQFASLLLHHWLEEAQHAKLDTLLANELAAGLTPAQIKQGFDDFMTIGGAIEGLLRTQVGFDIDALERHVGRAFSPADREEISVAQVKSYRWTFLVTGLQHPTFVKAIGELSPEGQKRIADLAVALGG